MSLSVCMITRDEEKNLARALSSVSDVADEIIVTDTGSTDRTVEIARDFGAKVFYFAWCDDFSAARNASIDKASGDWIFWLDADEELLHESIQAVCSIIRKHRLLACYISRQDLIDVKRPEYFTEMWQVRLFRNRPDLRFIGRCHPHFKTTVQSIANNENLEVIRSPEIKVRHYGYGADDQKKAKLKRAVHLLELELAERPGQLYYLIEYGRTLLQLNDPRSRDILALATEKLLEHKGDPSPPTPIAAALLEYLLQLPREQLPCALTPQEVRELALRWFPNGPPLLWIMAQQAFSRGNYGEAEKYLESLVEMGRTLSYDRHVSFDPRIIGGDALLNLGVCRIRMAKLKAAEECFKDLIQMGHRVKAARANLKTINRIRTKHKTNLEKKKKKRARRR